MTRMGGILKLAGVGKRFISSVKSRPTMTGALVYRSDRWSFHFCFVFQISMKDSLISRGKESLLIPKETLVNIPFIPFVWNLYNCAPMLSTYLVYPVLFKVMDSAMVDRCPHPSEIQSLVLAKTESIDCLILGSVDSSGHLIVSKLDTSGKDVDRLTFSVSPRDCGVGEGSWAGLCFSPNQWSMAAVARSFCKSVDVYDQDIHLRTLRTLWNPSSLGFLQSLCNGNESSIIAVTEGCQLTIWDLRTKENGGCVRRVCGSVGDIFYALCDSSTGNIAVGGADRTVTIYDPRRWSTLSRWVNCSKYEITGLSFSSVDSDYIYVQGLDYEVLCGQWKERKKAFSFRGDSNWLGFSKCPNRDVLGGWCDSGSIFVADVAKENKTLSLWGEEWCGVDEPLKVKGGILRKKGCMREGASPLGKNGPLLSNLRAQFGCSPSGFRLDQMPATEYQGSAAAAASYTNLGRSFFSIHREQVHSMDTAHEATSQEQELEAFQRQVAQRFHDLSSVDSNDLLSLSWISKLLDAFICCQEEFRAILFNNRVYLNRPPLDRLLSEFFDRSVKALDVCNAIRDGIEQIRQWQKQLEIVLCALDNQRSLGEGQFRRAKKALIDLAIGMLDERESNAAVAHRNRSFGRNNAQRDHRSLGHFRSLSWSVSRNWSAARQLQAIGNSLAAPRPNDIMATNGLAVAVFTMNYVLLFVMWALVAAIPCQDRGLQTHFYIAKQFGWAGPILSLHERIMEGSKKRDRRTAPGLLKEIREIEKCARHMNELTDTVHFPLTEEKEGDARQRVQELALVYGAIKEGLDPVERQVREVFHRIVRSRTEGLDSMGRANHE
ncbi:hypothetical protein RJ639_000570 [Escallonia herrerae]|uniref:Uncharacterized protein n=1 Tax=Escallonia herrerae TaxID=1293975 RepID=A0AA88XCZ1_9ASTE|nr:hypothetical protein RJ639_000570 [Escallonia herrerae]